MTRSERLQVTPVKDGPLPKSRVAEATLATLQMAPLLFTLDFYIVCHLQFTTGALPPTASAEKIELPATQPSRPGCRKNSLQKQIQTSISRILELFVEN